MNFKKKRNSPFDKDYYYKASKNNFEFNVYDSFKIISVFARHKKKDIRFNSLWQKDLTFSSLEDVFKFCEDFNYTKHSCLGKDL